MFERPPGKRGESAWRGARRGTGAPHPSSSSNASTAPSGEDCRWRRPLRAVPSTSPPDRGGRRGEVIGGFDLAASIFRTVVDGDLRPVLEIWTSLDLDEIVAVEGPITWSTLSHILASTWPVQSPRQQREVGFAVFFGESPSIEPKKVV